MKPFGVRLRLEFSSVTVSFFLHATEDHERLLGGVSSRLGLDRNTLELEEMEGHFGNKIVTAKAHVTGRNAQRLAAFILANISSSSRSKLLSEFDRSMDEHDALYLRIDRQSLESEISFSDQEPIRVKIKPKYRAGGRGAMKEAYRELIK
jgi:RNA binding exosome subunit